VDGSYPVFRSIAVLPIENLSNDPTQEWFSDGMAETLIRELVANPISESDLSYLGRAFLGDGDVVALRGYCQTTGARRIGFGECRGRVVPAIAD